jgi:hypothetical protein
MTLRAALRAALTRPDGAQHVAHHCKAHVVGFDDPQGLSYNSDKRRILDNKDHSFMHLG